MRRRPLFARSGSTAVCKLFFVGCRSRVSLVENGDGVHSGMAHIRTVRSKSDLLAAFIAALLVFVATSAVAVEDAAAKQSADIAAMLNNRAPLQQFTVKICLTINSQPIIARASGTRLPDGCWQAGTAWSTDTIEVTEFNVAENEQIGGVKTISAGTWIGRNTWEEGGSGQWRSHGFSLVSQNYPNGTYVVKFSLEDSSGRSSARSATVQIFNSTPSVIPGQVSMTEPRGSGDTASATIAFQALPATAATVELLRGKNPPVTVDVDLSNSVDGVSSVVYDKLEPSTKYRYRIVARNANGQSSPSTGSFRTPDVPKTATGPGSSSASGGSRSSGGTCPIVLYWRLDKAESALRSAGCKPQSLEHPSCRAAFGIVRKSNWQVVVQRGNTLLACQN